MDAIAEKLGSITWEFTKARTNSGPHRIHPYPARFIPQIPRTLIELFHPGDNSAVLDPFCGSGTTLVEANFYGLPAVGIDLHPLAVLIAKVKTTPISSSIVTIARQICEDARCRFETGGYEIPVIPRLDHWFRKPVQQALASLLAEINSVRTTDIADALKVALSSIIVRVSNQDSDTRYAAVDKNISASDVWKLFQRAVSIVSQSVSELSEDLFSPRPFVELINRDLLLVAPDDIKSNIGLVVTSPPYPNAYEYWLYHKYRMYWLGMDPISVRESEIGARPHYFKKNHQTEIDFECQMERCFSLLSKVMVEGTYACFIVGRSIIHGREINNEIILERAASKQGFRKAAAVSRRIARHRKSFNLSHAAIDREGIIVFRRTAE